MANFYTHYLIAEEISKSYSNLDKNAFIIGSLVPGFKDLEHDKTHLDIPEDILEKYLLLAKNKEELSFVYGYYLHLLVDKYYLMNGFKMINSKAFHLDKIDINVIDFIDNQTINNLIDYFNNLTPYEVIDDQTFIENNIETFINILDGWLSPNRNYTSLLIDLDNTIFDFNLGEDISLRNVFKKHNIECSNKLIETYKEVNHDLWKKIEEGLITKDELNKTRFTITFKKMGLDESIGPLCGIEYREELNQRHDYLPNAHKAMELLSQNYDISIITNGVSTTQRSRLGLSDLLSYVNNVFISSDIGYEKPNAKYFRYVLDEIKEKDISKILVVGDSLSSDIKGANSSHLDAIWINSKYKKTDHSYITMMPSISSLYTFLNRKDL